jgi:hypothetical protein
MKPLVTMVGAGLLVGLMATTLFGSQVFAETALGTLGPLVAACGSWLLIERTMRRDSTQVTPMMMKLFAVKMLFFGAFVVAAILGLRLRPVPFMVSFTSAFVAMYALEAFYLQRLFAAGLRASARS